MSANSENILELINSRDIVVELGELPLDAVVTEQAVATMFDRCPTTVKRAVNRGQLPPPVKLFGKSVWTARALIDHVEERLASKKRIAEEERKRLSEYMD